MGNLTVTGIGMGTQLQALLMSDDIGVEPGSDPSYQTCKTIYLYHPLGRKMAEKPVSIAQSQRRELSIPDAPAEAMVREAFEREWEALGADKHIFNVMRLSRIYGVASVAYGAEGWAPGEPIPPEKLAGLPIYFNVFDPLNTAGSLVLNQNPNAPDFQKQAGIAVSGSAYHRSRSCVMLNEEPIYIAYTVSAFGFVGRSVYQRALFPLKSFVQSMITDDMVTRKAGVLIAKMKPPGSIVDSIMQKAAAVKRALLKEAQTDNVLGITPDESIETLNMTNTDTAMTTARKNILENIASAADMPAQMLNSETFVAGFGEGTEDAKAVAQYVDGIREDMAPLYKFFDRIVQYRAWNPEFYKAVQGAHEEYAGVPYAQAFYQWSNSFRAKWPSLLKEPESELVKVEKVKLEAIIDLLNAMAPGLDPENKATMYQWAADNFNEQEMLFKQPLVLDTEALASYVPPQPGGPGAGEGDEP